MPKRLAPEVGREARRLVAKGHGLRKIGRSVSTGVPRGGRKRRPDGYVARRAHQEAGQRARRPTVPKLAHVPLEATVRPRDVIT